MQIQVRNVLSPGQKPGIQIPLSAGRYIPSSCGSKGVLVKLGVIYFLPIQTLLPLIQYGKQEEKIPWNDFSMSISIA